MSDEQPHDETRPQPLARKLAAIFSADVRGYSRLMGDDEAATISTLTAYREVMTSLIQQHRGRVVDSPGDNLLAEFASAVDAVQGAVAIQQELKTQNTELPDHRKMEYRIGINVGDVVVEGERIYGDGVNIAARLESLADGGGLCISGTVYDQVKNKLTFGYAYQGEQSVKNIAEPVRAYKVELEAEASPRPGAEAAPPPVHPKTRRARWKVALAVTAALLLLGVGIAGIVFVRAFPFPLFRTSPSAGLSQELRLNRPTQASLAVLPFANLSADPEQEYFSDGLTEDLITGLAKLSGLFVIARNSVFTYKGKNVDVKDVGRELGVRYVLEGSVRQADNLLRINAQLVDTTTGGHVWAEMSDWEFEFKDLFAVQDEIREKIVFALKVKLTPEEQERLQDFPTDNLEAYDAFLQGLAYNGQFTKEANAQARQLFERAIELDPEYAAAYAMLSATYLREGNYHWGPVSQAFEHAFELAQKAVIFDESSPLAHSTLGHVYLQKGQPEQALAEVKHAITLSPNSAGFYVSFAEILIFAGRPQDALEQLEQARRLDPRHAPHWVGYLANLASAYRLMGRYEEAITTQKQVLLRNPKFLAAYRDLAIIYHELGQEADAQAAEEAVRRINPNFPLGILRQRASLKDQQEEFGRLFRFSWLDNVQVSARLMSGFGYYSRYTPEANVEARQEFAKAAALDPQFAMPYAAQALTYATEWGSQWSDDPQTLEHAFELAHKAVTLDDSLAFAHMVLCFLYPLKQQYERAIHEGQRAVALDPDNGDFYAALALSLIAAGRPEEALGVLEQAEHLNPRLPAFYFTVLGIAYFLTGRTEEVLEALQEARRLNPNELTVHLILAAFYGELGREEEARAAVAEVRRSSPNFSLEGVRQRTFNKDPAMTERYIDSLRKAGLE